MKKNFCPYQPGFNQKGHLASVFNRFRHILFLNNRVLEKIAEMEKALGGEYIFDRTFLNQSVADLIERVREVICTLNAMADDRYADLFDRFTTISDHLTDILTGGPGPLGHLITLDWQEVHRDLDHLVGAKNANLGEIMNSAGLAVPDGFALTATAYQQFMNENDLYRQIRAVGSEDISIEAQAEKISSLFSRAKIPAQMAKAISASISRIEKDSGGPVKFAVRSSAVGEDGSRSFAGQFRSILNVPGPKVADACLQVMASRFSTHVMRYLGPEVEPDQVPMAVSVQVMVPAYTAGVTYSLDPNDPGSNTMFISAVPGSGAPLVSGMKEADQYSLGRQAPFPLFKSRIRAKQHGRENLFNNESFRGLERGSSILTSPQLHRLAEAAMLLEKTFDGFQDIEWAITSAGLLVILQCRPLKMAHKPAPPAEHLAEELRKTPVIMAGSGQVAQLGVAAGRVAVVSPDASPSDFPVNHIAVCRHASPQLSDIVRRAAAIITDIGSPTGHLATIAREYRTPALFGTGTATEVLSDGMEVTVDVEDKKIYAGIIPGLLSLKQSGEEPLADYPEMRILRRLLRLVAPLTLQNPAAPDFKAGNCRTFHDILRFCHEKAVETLITIHSAAESGDRSERGKILTVPIPIRIRVIDLGGGARETGRKNFSAEDIESRPFNAVLRGMLNQEAWNREPVPFGFKDLMAGITSPMKIFSPGQNYTGENLAIIAENYCNLSLRLGYHFNVIDTYLAADPDDNYIYFRFIGGMAEEQKRSRRIELISRILSSLYFKTERQGDLLVGKAKMLSADHIEDILVNLGELIAFTRQLDVSMVDDSTVERLFAQFLNRTLNGWSGREDG